MAYAFKRIEDALNQNTSNILAPENDGMMNEQGSFEKTSSSADLGTPSQGSSYGSTSGSVSSSYNPEYKSDQSVIDANVGKSNVARGGVESIASDVRASKQKLQDAANAYTEAYKSRDYNASNEDLTSAIETGDEGATTKVRNTINAAPYQANQFSIKPEDVQVKDGGLIGSQAGLQKLAARGQDERYTAGMGAFDATLLQKDPSFQRLVNETRADYRALNDDVYNLGDTLESESQQFGEQAVNDAKVQAEQFIQNYQQGLLDQQRDEAQAYRNVYEGKTRQQIQDETLANVLQSLDARLENRFGNADYGRFLDAGNVDVGSYFDFADPQSVNLMDFIDEGEAGRLNRAAGLLNSGDVYQGNVTPQLSDLYNLPTQDLQKALFEDISGRRQAANVAGEQTLRDLDNRALDRFYAYLDQQEPARERLRNRMEAEAVGLANNSSRYGQDLAEQALDYARRYALPEPEFLQISDFFNSDEANQANSVYKDLGIDRNINYSPDTETNYENALFNEYNSDEFLNYIRQGLERIKGESNAPVLETPPLVPEGVYRPGFETSDLGALPEGFEIGMNLPEPNQAINDPFRDIGSNNWQDNDYPTPYYRDERAY